MNQLPGSSKPGFLQNVGRFAKGILMPWTYTADTLANNTNQMIANQQFLQERDFAFRAAHLKYQHTLQIQRQEFEADQAHLSREFQTEENQKLMAFQASQAAIQRHWQSKENEEQRAFLARENELQRQHQTWVVEFSQACEDRRLKSRLEFEQYVLEQRHQWEIEAQKRAHEFQFFLEQFRLQATRDRDQFNLVLRDQPWKTQPMPILKEYEEFRKVEQTLPPIVVVSPPMFRFDYPVRTEECPNVAKGIQTNLTQFLEDHYPKESKERPAKPVPDLWNASGKTDHPAVIDLHFLFRSVPTLILESEVNAIEFNFRIFFWDAGQQAYSKTDLVRQFNYKLLLNSIQRQKAREWATQKQKLQQSGLDVARAMPEGSENWVNEYNLQQLLQEEQYHAAGITDLPGNYKVTPSGIRTFQQYLTSLHCLTAGLFLDSYHLFRSGVHPQMPQLVAALAQQSPVEEVSGMVEMILNHCHDLAQYPDQLGSLRVSDLLLEFALGLGQLEDSTWTAQLTEAAIAQWLQERDLEPGADPVLAVELELTVADVAFVEKLNPCWQRLQQDRRLDVALACYNRGLRQLAAQAFEAAIKDLDQVVYLQPQNPDGYFQRGLAYGNLQGNDNGQQAVADFTTVLELAPDRVEAYRWRGEAHYRLGHHELALADLREAANGGVAEAETRWQIVQGVWQDLQRQREAAARRQREEAERKRREEEERRKQCIITLKGGVILKLVSIEGGSFQMGSPDGVDCSNEHPQHRVTLQPFMMGKTPVTQAQWLAVMGSYKRHPAFKGNELPIENITWHEAKEFCDRLSKETKRQFTLPTEAQWEYACRAKTTSKWSFGNNKNDELGKYAWFRGNADSKTYPVAGKDPNDWWLYDMHGNVWEWCLDHWHGGYTGAPSNGMETWSSSDESSAHVIRGGSWGVSSGGCRSAYRHYSGPGGWSGSIGFRVVCL